MHEKSTSIVLAIIPARKGSKGLPGKNLRKLNGISLIGRAILAAKSVEQIDYVLVTTDCIEIAAEAEKYGAEVPFLRSSQLSDDLATTEITLQDALLRWETLNNLNVNLAVYFSPSEGFLNNECVARGINFLLKHDDYESYFSASLTSKNYWELQDNKFIRLKDWMSSYSSRQIKKNIYREDTGRGVVSRANLWRNQQRIGDRVHIEPDLDPRANLDIHSELDLRIAEIVLEKLGDKYFYKS